MHRKMIVRLLGVAAIALLALSAALAPAAQARPKSDSNPAQQRKMLQQYAVDTWQSFVAMVDPSTGLPADNIHVDTRVRSGYTSPTNIGTYIWSTLVARDLQIIKPNEARNRIARTLATVATLERHASGQFYNWYDPATGEKLTVWPEDGGTVYPFLSSVDNGWLAAGSNSS